MPGDVYGGHRSHQRGDWTRDDNPAAPSTVGYQHGRDLHDGHGQETTPLGSIREQGRAAREDPGMSGYRARIFEDNGSPSSSSRPFPAAGPPPLPPGSRQPPVDRLAVPPPEPGQHPSFDAKVAAEFFRMRDAKASSSSRDGSSTATASRQGRPGGAPPPQQARAFESDVEKAMREMEARLALAGGDVGEARGVDRSPPSPSFRPADDGSRGSLSRLSLPSSGPSPSSAAAEHHHHHQGRADEGSMLSQMDMRRVVTGGGKGKPGGLRDMWDAGTGGGGGGTSDRDGTGRHSSAQQAQRHGPGLKGMWGGDDPAAVSGASSLRPQRQGPGLRGLWSGPDMAADDAARTEAQAAYFSALNRDNRERRTLSGGKSQRQEPRGRRNGGDSPYGGGGVKDGDPSEHGTSLVGIGTPRGEATPRARRSASFGGVDGGNSSERAADRARKAAYAEELRKQMAEKEARAAAMDGNGLAGGRRRRASTGAGRESSGGGGGYSRAPVTPRSHGRESYSGRDGTETFTESPFESRDRWAPSAAWSTPPNGSSSGGGGGDHIRGPANGGSEGRVTAARRRLVEDVYGGGGMGAALGGAGYRRASTGSYGVGGAGTGTGPPRVTSVDQIRGGVGGDEPTAAVGGAEIGTSSQSSYLRTGAGVQSLRESEHGDSKWQKRAAALEQQRALEEQIASKARAKREEEERRKREEEEEAREQLERLRQLEAEAEEERRRKQAEQQEQLQGLYRQQDEALRKRRGGGGGGSGSGRQSNASNGEDSYRAPAYGGRASVPDDDTDDTRTTQRAGRSYTPASGGRDGGYAQSLAQHQGGTADLDLAPPDRSSETYGDGTVGRGTARRWGGGVPDVDDLPAGAQARAQVLRSSPPHQTSGGGGGGVTSAPRPSSWRPGSATSGRGGGGSMSNGRRGENASPGGAGVGTGRRSAGGVGGSGDAPMADRVIPGATNRRGRGGTPPLTASTARDGGSGGGGAVPPGPPLRTSSSLVPVTSATLFPPHPDEVDNAFDEQGPFSGRSDGLRLRQQSFVGDGSLGGRVTAATTTRAGATSVEPPQDEMDAFVTEWQAEHLRRRGRQGQGHSQPPPPPRHQQGGGGKTVGNGYHHPAPSSPGGRTVCESPPPGLLGSPRSRRSTMNGATGRDSRVGKTGELEESLAASSRMVDHPPSLPQPPSSYPGGAGGGGVGGLAGRPWGVSNGGGGGVTEESAMDLNEQSLTSDSILFYLSGQQREATADKAPAAGAGRASTNGRPLSRSRASGNATAAPRVGSRLGREMLRDSSEDGGGAGGDRGYGSDGGGSGAGAAPPGETRPLSTLSLQVPGDSVQLEEEDDMMSPLTRLLAETPVRLAPAGDFRRQQEAYPRTAAAARSIGPGPHAHGLHAGATRTDRPHPVAAAPKPARPPAEGSMESSLGGGTSWPSRTNDGSSVNGGGDGLGVGGVSSASGAARAARRARALWGASPPSGSRGTVAGAGGGGAAGTVAEALARKGGGVPWEEMPPTSPSSEAPLHR